MGLSGRANSSATFYHAAVKGRCDINVEKSIGTLHTHRYFSEVLSNQPEIRLYLPFFDWFGSKRSPVWFQINRKRVNTIWFQVDLTRLLKNVSVCRRKILTPTYYRLSAWLNYSLNQIMHFQIYLTRIVGLSWSKQLEKFVFIYACIAVTSWGWAFWKKMLRWWRWEYDGETPSASTIRKTDL